MIMKTLYAHIFATFHSSVFVMSYLIHVKSEIILSLLMHPFSMAYY